MSRSPFVAGVTLRLSNGTVSSYSPAARMILSVPLSMFAARVASRSEPLPTPSVNVVGVKSIAAVETQIRLNKSTCGIVRDFKGLSPVQDVGGKMKGY
jgi:hypothetical protein